MEILVASMTMNISNCRGVTASMQAYKCWDEDGNEMHRAVIDVSGECKCTGYEYEDESLSKCIIDALMGVIDYLNEFKGCMDRVEGCRLDETISNDPLEEVIKSLLTDSRITSLSGGFKSDTVNIWAKSFPNIKDFLIFDPVLNRWYLNPNYTASSINLVKGVLGRRW